MRVFWKTALVVGPVRPDLVGRVVVPGDRVRLERALRAVLLVLTQSLGIRVGIGVMGLVQTAQKVLRGGVLAVVRRGREQGALVLPRA